MKGILFAYADQDCGAGSSMLRSTVGRATVAGRGDDLHPGSPLPRAEGYQFVKLPSARRSVGNPAGR